MPQRHHPTHGVAWPADHPPIVFLTVCTKNRTPWLASSEVHETLRSVWQQAANWAAGRYVLMPDHLHLFAAPVDPATTLERWVTYWKSQFSKQHGNHAHRWQTDHWDRRLRNGESYEKKWRYVCNNPVRAGLVNNTEDWSFQGELNPLRWD